MGEDKNKLRAWTDKYLKPWVLVAAFLLVLLYGLANEADAAEIEAGPTFLSSEFSESAYLLLTEKYGKYSFGIGLVGPQTCYCRSDTTDVRQNAFVQVQRLVPIYRKFSVGIGVSYWNGTSRVNGSHFAFPLSLRYDINDRLFVGLRHWSNAGSAKPNLGQDAIYIGWRL